MPSPPADFGPLVVPGKEDTADLRRAAMEVIGTAPATGPGTCGSESRRISEVGRATERATNARISTTYQIYNTSVWTSVKFNLSLHKRPGGRGQYSSVGGGQYIKYNHCMS